MNDSNNPYFQTPYQVPNTMVPQQQPAQGYPQQPAQYYQQPQAPQYQQPVPQQQPVIQQPNYPVTPQHMPTQLPQYFTPDEQSMVEAYRQHRAASTGSNLNFVKFLGPNGEEKWDNVPINYTSMVRVYLLPPWAQGKHIFAIAKSHFWKSASKPGGTSIVCPGKDICKVCQARIQGLESPDANIQKRAKEFGRVQTRYYYQVALLDNIGAHFETGVPTPYVLQAGSKLHGAIGNLIEDKSISIFDPNNGRPLRVKKTKVGPDRMNIEYQCTDEDPTPLPQQLWGLLENLFDLEMINKNPTDQEMMEAVQDMGLMVPQYAGNNPYQMQYPVSQVQQPMPNLVQPNVPMQQNPPMLNPPPVNSGQNTGNYSPQPSQIQQPIPQSPVPQVPQQQQPVEQPKPMVRQPIPVTTNQPQTLEQLQQAVQGNK